MKRIPLTQGQFALVDDADFEWVNQWKWYAKKQKSGNFYAARNVYKNSNQTTVFLHWEILNIKNIDHKNGNGLDCCRKNLRPATSLQNSHGFCRPRPNSSSQFRGVSGRKSGQKWKWQSRVLIAGMRFYCGQFDDETKAARAYDNKVKELGFFREALNFPHE